MNEEAQALLPPGAVPAFAPGVRLAHNEAQGWVLLAPERVFKTDDISVEILKLCDGKTTIASIVNDLGGIFEAPREQIFGDVSALFASLAQKKLVIVA